MDLKNLRLKEGRAIYALLATAIRGVEIQETPLAMGLRAYGFLQGGDGKPYRITDTGRQLLPRLLCAIEQETTPRYSADRLPIGWPFRSVDDDDDRGEITW